MSAGYIQLTALGQQDIWLTGEPQVTYFAGVYRRHTPFVLEAYDIPFLGQNIRYGSQSICRIPPKGDLVRGLTLALTLPQLSNTFGANDWYWPIIPNSSNAAQIVVNSVTNTANVGPAGGVTWYSTYNATAAGTDQWLYSTAGTNGPLSNWVRYDSISNKFIFSNSNLTQLWVRASSTSTPGTNQGIFWGLDPLQATYITTYAGSTWYGYQVTGGNLSAQLTLEQSGWLPNPTVGLPPAPSRSGLFLQTTSPVSISSGLQALDLTKWTSWDTAGNFTVTPQGQIGFVATGIYIMKVGMVLGSGSMSSVSWGQTLGTGVPAISDTYEWRVSPNPSSPAVFPISITDPSSNVTVFAAGTGPQISNGSYISLNPVDDYFRITSNIVQYQSPQKIPFYGNTFATGSTTTVKATDGSMTWTMSTAGTYLISAVVNLSNGYVSSATLFEGANTVYSYDMTTQGRNPTFSFCMPMVITDTARKYYMNISTSNTTSNIQVGTFFAFNQVGIPSNSPTGTQGILPYSGLTFQSNVSTLTSPLNLQTNFTSNGFPYVITLAGASNLAFTTTGTYVVTGVISTADQLTSISVNTTLNNGSISTTSWPVSLGLSPPWTLNVPFRISNTYAGANTSISVTVNGTTASPNIFANTFFTVYPFASNTISKLNYGYYDSVGTLAIQKAELKIGGQLIQSLTGEAIELWNDLNIPYENQAALKVLTGKLDTTSNITAPRTYYVNLPFYFFGSSELSIPICALDRQDIEVYVTFNNFSSLTSVTTTTNPSLANPTISATIITEYVYLSEPEIQWFRRNRIEQVILQCQYQNIPLPYGFASGVFKLEFNNPIRELFFVIQNDTNLPYDYSGSGLQSLGLSFNGYEAFTSTTADAIYLGTIEPFNHYTHFPDRKFYMYCFCTTPGSVDPSGFVNFSRIKQVLVTLNLVPNSATTRTCRIVGVNYNVLRIENGLAGLGFGSS